MATAFFQRTTDHQQTLDALSAPLENMASENPSAKRSRAAETESSNDADLNPSFPLPIFNKKIAALVSLFSIINGELHRMEWPEASLS